MRASLSARKGENGIKNKERKDQRNTRIEQICSERERKGVARIERFRSCTVPVCVCITFHSQF